MGAFAFEIGGLG